MAVFPWGLENGAGSFSHVSPVDLRYTAAYEDHKCTSSSNEKKKNLTETPAVVLYQPDENAWVSRLEN